MQRRSFLVLVSELLALASIFLPGTASAFDYQISSPLVHDKLAVYFVHGNGSGGPVPLTLDQALANGAVKIHQDIHRDYFFTLSNSSNQSVFVQFGDLLKGGLQDQVVGRSLIVPPRSGPVPLDVLCVDPFRSTARDGEDGRIFLSSGAQFPSHTGKLSMLTGSSESEATRGLQQSGVWWSIDTTRSRLSQVLGEPLESPRAVHWKIDDGANNRAVVALAARRSSWTSSLPLALENRRLAQAQRPYVDALKAAGKRSGDIIGAVFVINGKVQGAEIYQSHVLFRHMWQKVLRAYATEAISSKDALSGTPPSVDTINAFLADAEGGQLRERTSDSHVLFRDSEAAIYAETQERDGRWVYRSYLSKLDPAAMPLTPDATVVKMLETGQVNGRPINTLADDETVVLRTDTWGSGWSATIHSLRAGLPGYLALFLYSDEMPQPQLDRHLAGSGLGRAELTAIFTEVLFFTVFVVLIWRASFKLARRKSWDTRTTPFASLPAVDADVDIGWSRQPDPARADLGPQPSVARRIVSGIKLAITFAAMVMVSPTLRSCRATMELVCRSWARALERVRTIAQQFDSAGLPLRPAPIRMRCASVQRRWPQRVAAVAFATFTIFCAGAVFIEPMPIVPDDSASKYESHHAYPV